MGFFKGLGDNCEVLMFIILFLLLFWDRTAALTYHPVDKVGELTFPEGGAVMDNVLGARTGFGSDCTVLFFILILLCLFWDRGLFSGGCRTWAAKSGM